MNLAIRMNDNPMPDLCPLCGSKTNPNIGAELMLADSPLVVCRSCGRDHAPALVALLDLAWLGSYFNECERAYGDARLAMMDVPM